MQITLENIEEKKGWNWSFESELGATLMLEIFFGQFEKTPEYNYFEKDDVMVIALNNKQVEEALGNLAKQSDEIMISMMIKDLIRLQNKALAIA